MEQFKCPACGAPITISVSLATCECEYCGTLFSLTPEMENAAEKIEQQHAKADAKRQIELEKQTIAEKVKRAEGINYQKSKYGKLIFTLFCISVLTFFISFASHSFLLGVVSIFQIVLFGLSWLQGMQILKEKFVNLNRLLSVLGIVLIIPVMLIITHPKSNSTAANTSNQMTLVELPTEEQGLYYKYIRELPEAVFTTTAKENQLALMPCFVTGEVTNALDILMSSNSGTFKAKAVTVSTEYGDVIVVDLLDYFLEYVNAEIGDETNIDLVKAAFNHASEYSIPEKGTTLRINGVYYGYSEVYKMPLLIYGINNAYVECLAESQTNDYFFSADYGKGTIEYSFSNSITFQVPAEWGNATFEEQSVYYYPNTGMFYVYEQPFEHIITNADVKEFVNSINSTGVLYAENEGNCDSSSGVKIKTYDITGTVNNIQVAGKLGIVVHDDILTCISLVDFFPSSTSKSGIVDFNCLLKSICFQ